MSEFRRRLFFTKKNKEVNEFVATYNVNKTGTATQLFGSNDNFLINQVKEMYINDIEITPTKSYIFQQVGTYTIRCVMAKGFKLSRYMFHQCTSLTTLDFSNVDTSNVTEMQNMFQGCNSIVLVNLSNIDTRNVIYVGNMFSRCSSLTMLDLSNFDTSKVMTLNDVFYKCTALTSLDLSSWDIKNISSFKLLFGGCTSLISLNPMRNWTNGNISLSDSPVQALSIHQLLENAAEIQDGAKQKSLTLSTYTLSDINGSEYYLKIIKNAINKNIEIVGMDMDNIVIPNIITSIPEDALRNFTNIKSITIPSTVTYIGDNAFNGCINISSITMNPTTAPTLGENVWGDNESNYVGSNVSDDKYANIKGTYIGYDTDKWNVLFNECGFIKQSVSSIEYLESQGTNGQYINTNYLVKSTDVIKIKFSFVNSILSAQPIFGWRWNGSHSNKNQCYINTGNNGIKIAIGASSANTITIPVELNSKYEIEINPNAQKIIINGIETTVNRGGIDWDAIYSNGNSVYPPYLFTLNNIGTKSGANNVRIYDYIVYDINGNEVQHLTPISDDYNRPCMYDAINDTYHYNQATGNDFTYQI